MIENKVLVSVIVPILENNYDIYFPVNRKISNVIKMIKSSLQGLSQGSFDMDKQYVLYNKDNGEPYDMNILVIESNIRNGSSVILL
jgi:hypothetical protein